MALQIRPVSVEDAAELAKLLRKLGWFKQLNGLSESGSIEQVAAHLATVLADDSHTLFVATHPQNGVIGYVAAHWLPYLFMSGAEGFVSELFVDDVARGKGVGSKLLNAIEVEARTRNCSRLQLVNFRHRESYERGFYEKQGWEERPLAASFAKSL